MYVQINITVRKDKVVMFTRKNKTLIMNIEYSVM